MRVSYCNKWKRFQILPTGTWILTDGGEKCVGDVISKAVRGYAEAYGMQQLQVIGLVPWRRLYDSHLLRCDDYLVGESPRIHQSIHPLEVL